MNVLNRDLDIADDLGEYIIVECSWIWFANAYLIYHKQVVKQTLMRIPADKADTIPIRRNSAYK